MASADIDALLSRPKLRGPQCTVCALPDEVRADLRYGRSKGLEFSVLVRDYLAPKGYGIKGGTLSKHFREHEQQS